MRNAKRSGAYLGRLSLPTSNRTAQDEWRNNLPILPSFVSFAITTKRRSGWRSPPSQTDASVGRDMCRDHKNEPSYAPMEKLNVQITIADTWPTSDELETRDRIIAALTASGVGACVGCGSGRGNVDFTLLVSDSNSA